MNNRPLPCVAFALLAALASPCPGARAADGADPASSDEKQTLIRKHIAAHASEDPGVREEARQALLKIGGDAAEELARSIERSDAARERLAETLGLLRKLELTPQQQKLMVSLTSIRITTEIQEQPLREVLAFLSEFCNTSFMEMSVPGPAPVTLHVKDLPLENAMNLIADQAGAVWYLDGQVFVFTPRKKRQSETRPVDPEVPGRKAGPQGPVRPRHPGHTGKQNAPSRIPGRRLGGLHRISSAVFRTQHGHRSRRAR